MHSLMSLMDLDMQRCLAGYSTLKLGRRIQFTAALGCRTWLRELTASPWNVPNFGASWDMIWYRSKGVPKDSWWSETACELVNETRYRSRAQGMVFETPEWGGRDSLCKQADNQLAVLDVVSVQQPRPN